MIARHVLRSELRYYSLTPESRQVLRRVEHSVSAVGVDVLQLNRSNSAYLQTTKSASESASTLRAVDIQDALEDGDDGLAF